MEILTPQNLWRGYDATSLPLGLGIISEKSGENERNILAYFNGPTTTNGVVRVFVRCIIPHTRKPLPAVVYLPDANKSVMESDFKHLTGNGYGVIAVDWAGTGENTPFQTIYPQSMQNAVYSVTNLTHLDEDARLNCRKIWSEIAMRAINLADELDGLDSTRVAIMGEGVATVAVMTALAVDKRPLCGITRYSIGAQPSEEDSQEYLQYKVALSAEAYAPLIKKPLLMMLASNERDNSFDDMCDIFGLIPESTDSRLSVTERANHTVGSKQREDVGLWLKKYLNGEGEIPAPPELEVSTSERVMYYNVKVPANATAELFIAHEQEHAAFRNWRCKKLIFVGEGEYIARVDAYDVKKPIYAFATATLNDNGMSVSSPLLVKVPATLGVQQMDKPANRLLYEVDMGQDDWIAPSDFDRENNLEIIQGPFNLSGISASGGHMFTFKLGDIRFRGANEGLLQILIYSTKPQNVEFKVVAKLSDEEDSVDFEEFVCSEELTPMDNWRKLTFKAKDFHSLSTICPEWPDVVSFGVRSQFPVAIASIIWV